VIDKHFLNKKCEGNNCKLRGSRPLKNWKGTEMNWYCEEHFHEYAALRKQKLSAFIEKNRDSEQRKSLSEEELKLYIHYTEENS
jgi:hypothetical protein